MKIAYSPFDDQDTVNAIYDNIRLFHRGLFSPFLEKYDLNIRVHDRPSGRQVLRDVRPDQQLYVFGHGSEGSDKIQPMNGAALSLAGLAEQLFMDGMSISQQKLKLFSCEGGRGGASSMAAKLKMHLGRWGYANIQVYGYTESLVIGTSGIGNQKLGESGARAKNVRVRF